jgi:hypothetical protein
MSLPLSQLQCMRASNWLKQNFEAQIKEMVYGTPWTVELTCAIFCQETASKVLYWIDEYEPLEILKCCVFDASGDFPGTVRFAFPKNKTEFEKKYGSILTNMLIDEANKQRSMPQHDAPRGYMVADYLYKGYGIFQYDLQHIAEDPEYFVLKKWYNMSDCMQKLVEQLNAKAMLIDNLHGIVKAYNGSGSAAEEYANNVMQFKNWIT